MSDLDALLRQIVDGLPPVPAKRYEMRCHPDVVSALQDAALAEPGDWLPTWPPPRYEESLFGHADVIADPGMPSGAYRLTEDGKAVKEGVLRTESVLDSQHPWFPARVRACGGTG